MSSISKPNVFSASTTISSSEVNDNFDTIYNDYNGNISSANLADNAVTTAKITDSNVTTAKLSNSSVTPDKLALGAQVGDETSTGTLTSTSYTATLSGTPGTNPSVTVTVPASGSVLVFFSAQVSNDTAGSRIWVAYAMSGANTVAASDNRALHFRSGTAAQAAEFSMQNLLTGLTPGSTTFTLQYKVNANTGTVLNRKLSVIPIA